MTDPPRASDPPRTLDPLRHPDFRRFWVGNGLSALGSHLTGLALPLLVLDQTGSAVLAGLVGTLRMLAYLAVHLPAGALADRLDRRSILLVADAVRALLILAIAVALIADAALAVPVLMTLAVVGTLLSSVADPASQAATRHLVTGAEMPAALALNTVRGQTITLAAPLVGGLLYQVWPALPFVVDAASYGASFLAIYLVRSPLGGRRGPSRSLVADIGVGLRFTMRSRFLVLFLVWAALGNFATAGITFVLVIAVLPAGGATLGITLSIVALGGLVGATQVSRAGRFPARVAVPVVAGLRTLAGCVMVAHPTPLVLTVGMTVVAFLGPALTIPYNAHVFEVVPDHLMGRVQTAMTLVGGSLYPFATVATGWLVEATSVAAALGSQTAILVVVLGMSLLPGLRIPERSPTGRRSG